RFPAPASRSSPAIDDLVLRGLTEHSMIFDAAANRFVVFGGITLQLGPVHNEVWERAADATGEWTLMAPLGTPPAPRYGHTAIFDAVRRRMIVFGGHGIADDDALWTLSLDDTPTWQPLATSGTPPVNRYDHSAVYDAAHDQMLVFGGRAPSLSNETWALKL